MTTIVESASIEVHLLFGYLTNFSYIREDHMILVASEDTPSIWQVRIHAGIIHEMTDKDVETTDV